MEGHIFIKQEKHCYASHLFEDWVISSIPITSNIDSSLYSYEECVDLPPHFQFCESKRTISFKEPIPWSEEMGLSVCPILIVCKCQALVLDHMVKIFPHLFVFLMLVYMDRLFISDVNDFHFSYIYLYMWSLTYFNCTIF